MPNQDEKIIPEDQNNNSNSADNVKTPENEKKSDVKYITNEDLQDAMTQLIDTMTQRFSKVAEKTEKQEDTPKVKEVEENYDF